MLGGQSCEMASVRSTPKAFAQYREFCREHVTQGQLLKWLRSRRVTRFADGSPYFVLVDAETGLRFVFCVAHGKTLADRAFCLVTVQAARSVRST